MIALDYDAIHHPPTPSRTEPKRVEENSKWTSSGSSCGGGFREKVQARVGVLPRAITNPQTVPFRRPIHPSFFAPRVPSTDPSSPPDLVLSPGPTFVRAREGGLSSKASVSSSQAPPSFHPLTPSLRFSARAPARLTSDEGQFLSFHRIQHPLPIGLLSSRSSWTDARIGSLRDGDAVPAPGARESVVEVGAQRARAQAAPQRRPGGSGRYSSPSFAHTSAIW